MNTATDFLLQDHRRIEAAVADLEAALAPLWFERIRAAIAALERLLTLHYRRETEIFFPQVAVRSDYARVVADALEQEQRFEAEVFRGARAALLVPPGETIDLAPLVQQCRFLARCVRHHLRQEETLILRPSESLLSEEENQDVLARMQAVKAGAA